MFNRKFTRFSTDTPATFEIEGMLGYPRFYLNDASQGGLCFNAPTCIKKGTKMNVGLYDNNTKTRAQISWCKSLVHSNCKMGLVFEKNIGLTELDRIVS